VGFDRDTLLEAGIEKAGAFAAVSSGDNSNIIAARLARESFGVANVVARIYDPARAEIYQRLGIQTVATVLWTTDQILRRLLPEGAKSEWSDPSGNVQLCEMPVHRDWFGQSIGSIQEMTSARVAFITRLGEGIVPLDRTILQEGDVLHIFVADKEIATVAATLARSPKER
jgi:trk system potassium uptake protein TrkA